MAPLIRRCAAPCMLGSEDRGGSRRHLRPRECEPVEKTGLPALFTKAAEYLRRKSQHLQGRSVRSQGREARVFNSVNGDEMQSRQTRCGIDVAAKKLLA